MWQHAYLPDITNSAVHFSPMHGGDGGDHDRLMRAMSSLKHIVGLLGIALGLTIPLLLTLIGLVRGLLWKL